MNMWSSGRRVLRDLLRQPAVRTISTTPAQNTVVVERMWQVPLSKVGSPPRLHPRRHRIYKLVDDTKHTPTGKMELILTQTVPKLGGRGDTVFVKKSVGRNKLLAQGLAVYPSPENKQMFAEELRLLREGKPEERVQTRTGQLTVAFLQSSKLSINKMPPDDFQVTKEVIRRQLLKKLGVVVPPHALSFPFESVKDVGNYWCEVTVNGMDTVRIPVSLVPFKEGQFKSQTQQQAVSDISEAAEEEKNALNAVPEATAVEAEAGNDSLSQDPEATAVEAEAGNDSLSQVPEATAVEAEAGNDSLSQVPEATAVEAEAGNDSLSQVPEATAVKAEAGNDSLSQVPEATAVEAEAGNDSLSQVPEATAVEAEAGNDSLSQVPEASASAGASAAEGTAANTPTSEETTPSPSDRPKKD